VCRQLWCRY